jgi:hypothetical protein
MKTGAEESVRTRVSTNEQSRNPAKPVKCKNNNTEVDFIEKKTET